MNKKLNELSKEQLIELIEKSKLNKKYGLVWEEDNNKELLLDELTLKSPLFKNIINNIPNIIY